MRRRVAAVVVAAVAGACAALQGCGPHARPPDIILITADDLSAGDIEPYGHPTIRTPRLLRLAAEGMRFDRAFLTSASCSPSRCSTVTGRYPHSTGAGRLHDPLPADQTTFLEPLRRAGYFVATAGKWHFGREARTRFDRIDPESPPGGAGAWIDALRARPRDRPSFLWLAAADPHRPYADDAPVAPHPPADVVVPPYLPDTEETREDFVRYYAAVERLDSLVGDALDEIEREGNAAHTLVLFMSDNGRPFPRAKPTLYDDGVRTPLLLRWPGRAAPGSVSGSLVSALDLAPTILEAAGLPAEKTMQGTSLLPLLADPGAVVREAAFAEHNWHDHPARERMARTTRYKYIRNYYPALAATPPEDLLRSPTWRVMERLFAAGALPPGQANPLIAPRPIEELYDVGSDPQEMLNRADDPAMRDVLAEMRRRYAAWQRDTDDRDTLQTPDPGASPR
jgi:arylsulfatase A-like enzyme